MRGIRRRPAPPTARSSDGGTVASSGAPTAAPGRTRERLVGVRRAPLAVRARWSRLVSLAGLTAAAVALGAFHLGSQSLWLDESYSAHFARSSLGSFPHLVRNEANMALYHLLLHLWLFLGQSEAAIRALSVVFAAATVPVLYLLAERLFGRTVGLVACALLVPNVFFVRYAQEARGYALALFLSVVASLLFVHALTRPSTTRWATYAFVVGLGAWAHLFVFLVGVAHVASLALLEGPLRPSRRTVLGVCGGMTVVAAPLAPFISSQNGKKAQWLRSPSPGDLARALEALAGGTRLLLLAYLAACLPFAVRAVRSLRHDRTWQAWRYAFVLSWLGLPIAISFLASQVRPVFLDRYLIVVLPALVLAAAAGLRTLGLRPVGAALAVVVLALSGRALASYYQSPTKPDWRSAAAFVLAHSRTGDGLVVAPDSEHLPLAYYFARAPSGRLPPAPIFPRVPWTFPGLALEGFRRPAPAALRAREELFRRVWLVVRTGKLNPIRLPERDDAAASTAAFATIATRRFRGIRVELFRPRP